MNARSALGIGTALALTALLGLFLRWQLAGAVTLFAEHFTHLRHAHTHLGFYGALLPLVWIAAAGDDEALPRATAPLYAAFVLLAILGFVHAGYGLLAIAGSTGVLFVWLFAAWRRRRLVVAGDGWLAGLPLALPIAGGLIPPLAVTLPRDPALAAQLVHVFLGVLVLGVLVPAALHVGGARAPRKPVWLLAALAGAAGLGFESASPLLLPAAIIILVAVWRAPVPTPLRIAWFGFGVGASALAVRLLPPGAATSVAAFHFGILGPVLLGLSWPLLERLPRALVVAWLVAVAAMSAAILAGSPRGAAVAGSAIVVVLLAGLTALAARR